MFSSSRVFSMPPRSALASGSDTSFTPEKLGEPYSPSRSLAASVSSKSRSTSCRSVAGMIWRLFSRAASLTALADSISNTAGSSSVRMDFSNNSLIMLYPWSIPLFVGKRNIYAAQCNGFLYPFVGAGVPDGPFWGISPSGASYFCPWRQK